MNKSNYNKKLKFIITIKREREGSLSPDSSRILLMWFTTACLG